MREDFRRPKEGVGGLKYFEAEPGGIATIFLEKRCDDISGALAIMGTQGGPRPLRGKENISGISDFLHHFQAGQDESFGFIPAVRVMKQFQSR